jgi:hypothetical protein
LSSSWRREPLKLSFVGPSSIQAVIAGGALKKRAGHRLPSGQAEFAVSETLEACAGDPRRGSTIMLPHLLGQRTERLAAAIGEGGAFATEGGSAVEALAAFRKYEAQRAPLAHGSGSGRITLDRRGQWTFILRMIAFRSGRAERSAIVWEQGEATAFCAALNTDAQRLCAKLAQVRRLLATTTGTATPN